MTTVQTSHYESDFALWVEDTVAQLKSQNFQQVDWVNLIEEVESLGQSQRSSVRSYLVRLLEHLLKRCYVAIPDCHRGWEIEIRNFRQRLMFELEDSPSLKNFMLEILPKCYGMALETVKDSYPQVIFPENCPFPSQIESLLKDK
ncbi:MAG: DUF29 domain-containing protein, partial [Microcystaceae cyanobacterium]